MYFLIWKKHDKSIAHQYFQELEVEDDPDDLVNQLFAFIVILIKAETRRSSYCKDFGCPNCISLIRNHYNPSNTIEFQ